MAKSFKKTTEILSWALYDFANTIYSINIISYHFPLWFTIDQGRSEWEFSFLMGLTSLVAALGLPILGFLSDVSNSRRTPLLLVTLLCVAFTGAMGFTKSIGWLILFFIVSHLFFQSAQVVYNAQITAFKMPRRMGSISGFGVGLGYVGTICGVLLTVPFFEKGGHHATFLPTAFLFLIFALPCLLNSPGGESLKWKVTQKSFIQNLTQYRFGRVWHKLREDKTIFYFGIFSFLMLNAAAIVSIFMTVFARNAAMLSEIETQRMILSASMCAIMGSVLFGFLYDRMHPHRVIRMIILFWVIAFIFNALFRVKSCFFVAASLAGFSLGAMWSVSRVYLVRIVPEKSLGEFYGIFALLGRVAMVTGPFCLAALLKLGDSLGLMKYDLMNAMLLILLGMSWMMWLKVESCKKTVDPPMI